MIVVKLGGSLLRLPGWPRLVRALVDSLRARPVTIVVGGGPVVDGMREIDGAAAVDGERWDGLVHGLAIDATGLTARLVAGAVGVALAACVARHASGDCVVLDVPAWLSHGGRLAALPVGWHVTSDSIAALVAGTVKGDLLLAKRVPPPCPAGEASLESLARAGWVDEHFPAAAAGLPLVTWAAPMAESG